MNPTVELEDVDEDENGQLERSGRTAASTLPRSWPLKKSKPNEASRDGAVAFESFLAFLQAHPPGSLSDSVSQDYLLEIKGLLELHGVPEPASTYTNQWESKPIDGQPPGISSSPALQPINPTTSSSYAPAHMNIMPGPPQAAQTCGTMHRKMALTHFQPVVPSLINSHRKKVSRILVAVNPHRVLTEEQSQTTVMMRLCGPRVAAAWFRHKKLMAILSQGVWWLDVVLYYLLVLDFLYADAFPTGPLIAAGMYGLVKIYLTVSNFAIMNFKILKEITRTFDCVYLFMELLLFGLSYCAVRCFSVQSVIFIIFLFGSFVMIIFYDSYPLRTRQSSRIMFAFCALMAASILVVLYARLPSNICYYRFSFSKGLVLPEEDGSECQLRKRERFTFWVYDFCLNRGFTVLFLNLKIAFAVMKHPDDCVILKSRIRLIEEHGNKSHKAAQQRS